jgi:hypothetical protein
MNESQLKPNDYISSDRARVLLENWKPVLEYSSSKIAPIEDERLKLNTAIVLENQQNWFNESNIAGNSGVFGASLQNIGQGGASNAYNSSDSYASGDARLPKVLIPMIRRIFPELITNEIVGVQPMTGPVGLAFALRYKYSATALNGSALASPQSTAASLNNGEGPGRVAGELGFQNLDTRFTGASTNAVSGTPFAFDGSAHASLSADSPWLSAANPFNDSDEGIAAALSYFELSDGSSTPTLEIAFEKTAVQAGTRRLGARWSVELEQDLKNMNGIDIDAELTNAMSYEIQAEIDREMIIRMIQSALGAGERVGYTTFNVASADGRWMAERNRAFYQKLIVEANRMAVRNRRGAANFIVATPRVCAILEMLPEFSWMTVNGNVNTQPIGIAKVGNVGGRFNIYRDTRTEAVYNLNNPEASKVEYALLGYKGPEYYDTGIVYCPYIPVMIQRTVDPNGFYPKVGLLTRYGVVDNLFGASNYYHVVFVKGMGVSFDPTGSSAVYF